MDNYGDRSNLDILNGGAQFISPYFLQNELNDQFLIKMSKVFLLKPSLLKNIQLQSI